jgi:hypothetical protein
MKNTLPCTLSLAWLLLNLEAWTPDSWFRVTLLFNGQVRCPASSNLLSSLWLPFRKRIDGHSWRTENLSCSIQLLRFLFCCCLFVFFPNKEPPSHQLSMEKLTQPYLPNPKKPHRKGLVS